MVTRLTQEEVDILNSILKYINPEEKFFNVESLHAINILQPLYPRTPGEGLKNYDTVRRGFTERRVYTHITDWLIEQGFAIIVKPPSSIYVDLKLTPEGEVLWAYSTLENYHIALRKSDETAIRRRVEDIIKMAFKYGEFSIQQELPKIQLIDFEFLTPDDRKLREKIYEKVSIKAGIVSMHNKSKIDEEAIGYLIQEGFAVNKHEIKDGSNRVYRQLTDRGRKLKELGTIELFNVWEANEKEQERIKIDTEREFIQKQNEFIGINKEFITEQSKLIASQLDTNRIANDTNKSTKRTSIAVAIFTAIAGFWYLHDYVYRLIPEEYCYKEVITLAIMVSLGIVCRILYRLLKVLIKSKKLKE